MGNYSRDTFDGIVENRLKHYVRVRLQQGVPFIDADWNEMEDGVRYELETFLKSFLGNVVPADNNGFEIKALEGVENDFLISGGGSESPGYYLIEGKNVLIDDNTRYSEQDIMTNPDLADNWGVNRLSALETPLDDKVIRVYLDVWEHEVNSSSDNELINPRIGIESAVRVKRNWVVRTIDKTQWLPEQIAGHIYVPLADINRRKDDSHIQQDDITDLRINDAHLTKAISSTGVVIFPAFEFSAQNVSGLIDHGLGGGPMNIQLGLDMDEGTNLFVGDPEVVDILGLPNKFKNIHLGALVEPDSGRFKIGVNATRETPSISVRWWAYKPIEEKEEELVAEQVFVSIVPDTLTIQTGEGGSFTAEVYGTDNKAVSWIVEEPSGGTIIQNGENDKIGEYTAPNGRGIFHIRVTSLADPDKFAVAEVTVESVIVTISPSSPIIFTGTSVQFTATVTGISDRSVTWKVNDIENGNSVVGTISASGLYTAPSQVPSSGRVFVKAVSNASPDKFRTASVRIKPSGSSDRPPRDDLPPPEVPPPGDGTSTK